MEIAMMKTILQHVTMMVETIVLMKDTNIVIFVNARIQISSERKSVKNLNGLEIIIVMMETIMKSVILMEEIVVLIQNISIAQFVNAKKDKRNVRSHHG